MKKSARRLQQIALEKAALKLSAAVAAKTEWVRVDRVAEFTSPKFSFDPFKIPEFKFESFKMPELTFRAFRMPVFEPIVFGK
jgi:hypothetical protein